MHLDLPTLGLVLFLVYLGNAALSAVLAWSGRTFPGAWFWVLGQGLLAAGAFFLFLRPWAPPWVPVVLGNGLYVVAGLPFAQAVWGFRHHRRFPLWTWALIPVLFLCLAAIVDQPFSTRVMVIAVWAAAAAYFPAHLLLTRVPQQFLVANSLTALPFLATAVASIVRFFWNWAFPQPGDYFDQAGPNALYVVGSLFISTVTLFGYFMMTGVRAEQNLSEKDEEIEARNRKLIESSRAKDLFFSVIAHDLRGPIGGAARYVRKHLLGKLTGLEAKYTEVETVAAALDKTYEFLEKLLWWSRAQLQDWAPPRQPVDLGAVFAQAEALVRSSADLKEIALEFPCAPYPQPLADPESVQLIVGNLLSNAVKFSMPGHRVQVSVAEVNGLCRITVEDQGVGMDAATIDRLFQIEDKLSTHGTSGERGSGMGLLLSQSLAERNRGGITIESTPGVGTRATLWLPTPGL